MKFRKFRKNAKALSPVIATIRLIAVTVAVSVVVAAWMGALTIGFMGNAENVKITNVAFKDASTAILTVQNNGANSVTINTMTIGTSSQTQVAESSPYPTPLPTGALAVITKGQTATLTVTLASPNTFTDGAQYNFQLITAKGTSVTSSAAYSSNSPL